MKHPWVHIGRLRKPKYICEWGQQWGYPDEPCEGRARVAVMLYAGDAIGWLGRGRFCRPHGRKVYAEKVAWRVAKDARDLIREEEE